MPGPAAGAAAGAVVRIAAVVVAAARTAAEAAAVVAAGAHTVAAAAGAVAAARTAAAVAVAVERIAAGAAAEVAAVAHTAAAVVVVRTVEPAGEQLPDMQEAAEPAATRGAPAVAASAETEPARRAGPVVAAGLAARDSAVFRERTRAPEAPRQQRRLPPSLARRNSGTRSGRAEHPVRIGDRSS
jgi:hypothetical protein